MPTIAFENEVQVALWNEELVGQLSDGMWENSRPHDHWKPWCNAEVIIDATNVGRDFWAQKDSYNFHALIEYVGDRMLAIVQRFQPNATERDLRHVLRSIKQIIKVTRR